jgi:hypothetical protein
LQLDGDNDRAGRGEPGSAAATEANRYPQRLSHDGDSNDDSDAGEGADKVGEMPGSGPLPIHRAAITGKGARPGSAAVDSSGPLHTVDYEANIQALVPDGSYNPLESGGASRQRAPSVVHQRRTLLKKKQLTKHKNNDNT